MILQQIDVSGFRGLSQLSLSLEQDNVLIGENAWGKSSLLDVLTLLLTPGNETCQFTLRDFHSPVAGQLPASQLIRIRLVFHESESGEGDSVRYRTFAGLWQGAAGQQRKLIYQVSGEHQGGENVVTRHQFISLQGQPLAAGGAEQVKALTRLHPVLRLHDARFNRHLHPLPAVTEDDIGFQRLAAQIDELTRELDSRPNLLTDKAIHQGLRTMQQLLEHYFSLQHTTSTSQSGQTAHRLASQHGWRYLASISQLIAEADRHSRRLILMRMFALLIQVRGSYQLDADARPLLLVEDPETRLHPIMLAVAWGLLSLLPLQKIVTTNSSELLAQVPTEQLRRLVREPQRITVWRAHPENMSAEDSRKIAFHIRFNRPSSLFARCWLLVEGETEVWVINELASQCGYHFAAEGIRVIEFAQVGLRPLVTFAQNMGIAWYVLTDGDAAGQKYAATTRGLLRHAEGSEQAHLTELPAQDMEHFLYKQGFADVYRRVARLPAGVSMNPRRAINRALHQSSKPELAIAVAAEAAGRGPQAIPQALRRMFAQVQGLARGKPD